MILDMTRGRPAGLLLRFAFPLMLSALLQQLYTLCDSIIIGRLLGTDAFAAIGSASYLNWFTLSMLLGATSGFGVALAQRFGAQDKAGFRRFLSAALVLSLAIGVLLTAGGVALLPTLLTLLKTPPELYPYALRYMRVLWAGLLFTAMLNVFSAALRAMGDSRTPFASLVLSTLMNIALDFVFILFLHLDVEGAALATVLSQGAAAAWCLRGVIRSGLAPVKADFAPKKTVYRELLRLGMPPLLCHGVTATGELFVLSAINACGVVFVTGMAASRRYFSLLNVVGHGLEGAVATFVGQNMGAGHRERILLGTRTAAAMGAASSMVIAALVILFAGPLILLFIPDGTDEAIRIGVQSLRVEALFLTGLYLLCEYRAAIQGMGNALLPMLSGFLELFLRVVCAYALPALWGREGLYFTDAITWALTAVMLFACYKSITRRMMQRA